MILAIPDLDPCINNFRYSVRSDSSNEPKYNDSNTI
nr:hypothetical protein CJLB15_00013 [Campylobacter phage CJLB-15]